jgi:hypothetical protein
MGRFIFRNMKLAYYIVLVILFGSVFLSPGLVDEDFSIFNWQILESLLILFLLLIYLVMNLFYKRELRRKQEEVNEVYQYLGELNVRMEYVGKLFSAPLAAPKNKAEMKDVMIRFADMVLGMSPVSGVLFRVIEKDKKRTIKEVSKARGDGVFDCSGCGNSELVGGEKITGQTVVSSNYKNTDIGVYCVLPVSNIDKSQEIMIQAVVNLLAAMYFAYGRE